MGKQFFEVFPELHVPSELGRLMEEVEVTKVSSNRDRDHLRVYLKSGRLIDKSNIYDLEHGIERQLFPEHEITVKIVEKYQLSGQYNPRKLMDVYKDSILEEFHTYSLLEYSILRMAQIEFPEDHKMRLTFEDSVVARQKSEEVVQILEKIICERCGLDVDIQVGYMEPVETKHKKNSDLQIQNEVRQIIRNSSMAGKQKIEETDQPVYLGMEEAGELPFSIDGETHSPLGSITQMEVRQEKNSVHPAKQGQGLHQRTLLIRANITNASNAGFLLAESRNQTTQTLSMDVILKKAHCR